MPTPENPLSISGWTRCNINHSGADTSKPIVTPIAFTDPNTGNSLTVYGGTLTINDDGTADIIVSSAKYDMGNLSWSLASSTHHIFACTISNALKLVSGTNLSGIVFCSAYTPKRAIPRATITNDSIQYGLYSRANYSAYYIRDDNYDTAANFKASVVGQTLIVPLATPQSYHIDDAEQFFSYLGTNNIWADCGKVTVIVSNNESIYTRKKLDSVFNLLNSQDITNALGYTPTGSVNDDILHGSNSGTAITYAPYTS